MQADKIELQNKIKRDELKEWSEVTEYISGIMGPLRDRILAVESYAAKANSSKPDEARKVLQGWIDDTLKVMEQLTQKK
jgi:hypothetical protein